MIFAGGCTAFAALAAGSTSRAVGTGEGDGGIASEDRREPKPARATRPIAATEAARMARRVETVDAVNTVGLLWKNRVEVAVGCSPRLVASCNCPGIPGVWLHIATKFQIRGGDMKLTGF